MKEENFLTQAFPLVIKVSLYFFCLKGGVVNKSELISQMVESTDLSRAVSRRALEAALNAIKASLKKGGAVSLLGFGTFHIGKRTARKGRNPQTGAAITIKATKVPKFRPSKGLKDAVK